MKTKESSDGMISLHVSLEAKAGSFHQYLSMNRYVVMSADELWNLIEKTGFHVNVSS